MISESFSSHGRTEMEYRKVRRCGRAMIISLPKSYLRYLGIPPNSWCRIQLFGDSIIIQKEGEVKKNDRAAPGMETVPGDGPSG